MHLQELLAQVCPPLHFVPHFPQLLALDFKLTQEPLQVVGVAAGQEVTHFPFFVFEFFVQRSPFLHFFPHPPQCEVFSFVLTHAPEQVVGVAAGQEDVHLELTQRSPFLQTKPHLPQLLTSVFGGMHFLLEPTLQKSSVVSHLQALSPHF